MAKCIRCGKSTLMRGHVKLIDADICTVCFKELGFDGSFNSTDIICASSVYKWADIQDGKDAYNQRRWAKQRAAQDREEAARLGLHFADYRTLLKLDCLDNEMKTVERICALLDDDGCDPKRITYEREPGGPLSAFVGDNLLYQLRYTKDVKWIRIKDGDKIRITGPAGINKLVDKLVAAYQE